jgi:cation diffusion facilitator family transporter
MDHADRMGWRHSHIFGQDQRKPGERRTFWVIVITAVMMVVEISAGILFGSMALLADGLHMASHAAALTISVFAYVYARRHAHDPRFSFGTGKVNALGGFSGAILLALFSLLMAWESLHRLVAPVPIEFNQAILVAVLGLVVNGVSVVILGGHGHGAGDAHGHEQPHGHPHDDAHGHADQNLRSAYLHVLADALTSILAIAALLAAKYFGAIWMDPVMGLVGAVLVGRWSIGLLRTTAGLLLDQQGPAALREAVRAAIEAQPRHQVADLHLWSIGPQVYAVLLTVVAEQPLAADAYKTLLPRDRGLEHITVEVQQGPVAGGAG